MTSGVLVWTTMPSVQYVEHAVCSLAIFSTFTRQTRHDPSNAQPRVVAVVGDLVVVLNRRLQHGRALGYRDRLAVYREGDRVHISRNHIKATGSARR
jgi:hypothetical protein